MSVVGVVQRRDTGRPEVVHGRRCKPTEVEHEVMVAEFEILTGIRLERSWKQGRVEPDGTGERDGQRLAVEIDNSGKMTVKKQMTAKWKRYEGFAGFVLVVAHDEGRMQRLRESAAEFKEVSLLFTTFDRLRSGTPEPWVDWCGNTTAV